jgi:hypothetical protein
MARIRTITPEFLKHKKLQKLEETNPGLYVMLVFVGLWTQADRFGRFLWDEDQMSLEILPWLDFDMGASLKALLDAEFIERYERDGKTYGWLPKFTEYQRFVSMELKKGPKHPAPPADLLAKYPGASAVEPDKTSAPEAKKPQIVENTAAVPKAKKVKSLADPSCEQCHGRGQKITKVGISQVISDCSCVKDAA